MLLFISKTNLTQIFFLPLDSQDRSPVPQAQRRGFSHPEGDPSGADVTR